MLTSKNRVNYLKDISHNAKSRTREVAVAAAILEKGYWEEYEEWRISTITTSRIEAFEKAGTRWFQVTVSCDGSMMAYCPTIARAVEFAGIFERLHRDLFWNVGWPSWAFPDQLEP